MDPTGCFLCLASVATVVLKAWVGAIGVLVEADLEEEVQTVVIAALMVVLATGNVFTTISSLHSKTKTRLRLVGG